jgi:nuclear migration protein JNM1
MAGMNGELHGLEDPEQIAKVNALYGTLATIESLSPMLPAVLDRLRSLRAIHADAATASESLGRVEKRQEDMGTEIQRWREGLEKVEAAMLEGEKTMGGNMTVVEGWVKELEAKMESLNR